MKIDLPFDDYWISVRVFEQVYDRFLPFVIKNLNMEKLRLDIYNDLSISHIVIHVIIAPEYLRAELVWNGIFTIHSEKLQKIDKDRSNVEYPEQQQIFKLIAPENYRHGVIQCGLYFEGEFNETVSKFSRVINNFSVRIKENYLNYNNLGFLDIKN